MWRRDDVPAYQLAVVADDAAMQITEVVRGADLLKSTARQLLLIRALGLAAPAYYHCDLVRDDAGVRLAKRHDALSLRALREQGYTPATGTGVARVAVIDFIAQPAGNKVSSRRIHKEGEAMRLNWVAILLAGFADWVLGAVWFTAFSNAWQAGIRMSPEELQAYMAHPNSGLIS